jgi:hypothetical protein
MRFPFILSCLFIILQGCAYHSGYDTARLREREYKTNKITLTKGGLTESQIRTIASTTPPDNFPLDLSIIIVKNGYIGDETEQLFISSVINELKMSEKIKRVVPIPKFLVPNDLDFSTIQELGVRTMTEYVVVFVVDIESFFKQIKILKTKYAITSAADFILVDPQTTAILASDRLFSKITYDESPFKLGEKEKAQLEIFTEQGRLFGQIIAKIFE